MRGLRKAYRGSQFHFLFNFSEEKAFGRSVLLISGILSASIEALTAGALYTGFLIGNGINIVNVGIIAFLPLIANCFGVFAPLILERFKKRRVLLAIGRISYFAINLLGLTLLPQFVHDPAMKVIGLGVIVFLANLVNALFTGGYTAWHLHFLPHEIRGDYFSISTVISTIVSSLALLGSSLLADLAARSGQQMTVIAALRYIAFALALVEMVFMLLPKEYPYARQERNVRLKHVFVLPLKNVKFRKSIAVLAVYAMVANLAASPFLYYLRDTVQVPYLFLNAIQAGFALFMLLFSPFWRRKLRKWSWWKTFAVSELLFAATTLLYAFVTPGNFMWLMLAVRLPQLFFDVGRRIAMTNLAFINMPEADQTNYLAFHMLLTSFAGFLGVSLGTWFLSLVGEVRFVVFGATLIGPQMLMLATAAGEAAIGAYILRHQKALAPD